MTFIQWQWAHLLGIWQIAQFSLTNNKSRIKLDKILVTVLVAMLKGMVAIGIYVVLRHETKLRSGDQWPTCPPLVTSSGVAQHPDISILLVAWMPHADSSSFQFLILSQSSAFTDDVNFVGQPFHLTKNSWVPFCVILFPIILFIKSRFYSIGCSSTT